MLKFIDLIGPEPKLTIENKSNFKSSFGGLMTLLISFIFISAFIGFGIDIIQKIKPRVTFNRIKNPRLPEFNLTDDNFLFTLYDQSTDKPIPNFERMFFVYYDYLSFDGNGTSSHKFKNPFHRCSKKTVDKWNSYFFYDPAGYYCLPEDEKMLMKGTTSTGVTKLLRIMVDYCKNNTDPNKGLVRTDCYTKRETQTFLMNKRIQMNYMILDSVINTFNFSYPVSNVILSDFVNTEPNTWSRLSIFLKEIQINTDKGFFIKDIETQYATGIDSSKFENFYTPDTDTVFSNQLILSDWIEVYDREYIKVQDTFAMMGGFVNFSLILIKYLNSYITRTQIVDIFNKSYCYVNSEKIGAREEKNSVFTRKEVLYIIIFKIPFRIAKFLSTIAC
jgi:hypothetical protein